MSTTESIYRARDIRMICLIHFYTTYTLYKAYFNTGRAGVPIYIFTATHVLLLFNLQIPQNRKTRVRDSLQCRERVRLIGIGTPCISHLAADQTHKIPSIPNRPTLTPPLPILATSDFVDFKVRTCFSLMQGVGDLYSLELVYM